MKNIRAISCVMIILGAVLVEVTYRLLGISAPDSGHWPVAVQQMLPALVGIIMINHGVKALLTQPS